MLKRLESKPRDRIITQMIERRSKLTYAQLTLEEAYGAVKPTSRPENWKKIRKKARWEQTQRRAHKILEGSKKEISTRPVTPAKAGVQTK